MLCFLFLSLFVQASQSNKFTNKTYMKQVYSLKKHVGNNNFAHSYSVKIKTEIWQLRTAALSGVSLHSLRS